MEDLETERWRVVAGYPEYEVSNLGRVKGHGRLTKPYKQNLRYRTVDLYKNGKRVARGLVHRLVANAFIPNPDNKPEVNHIDGNPDNNRVDNLEWVTHYENILHAHKVGLVPKKNRMKKVSAYTLDGKHLGTYISASEASRQTGVRRQNILDACYKRHKTAGGYIWAFA